MLGLGMTVGRIRAFGDDAFEAHLASVLEEDVAWPLNRYGHADAARLFSRQQHEHTAATGERCAA